MLTDIPATPLAAWDNFYVIVGSSGAALTGLQFIVITLVAGAGRRSQSGTLAAFATPSIVHFCVALLVSAMLSAPWPSLAPVAWGLGAIGLGGVGYAGLIAWRTQRQTEYRPVFEDWLWHSILPFLAYGCLFCAAVAMGRDVRDALFVVGGVTLLLLLIGIHNAWDTIIYLVTEMLVPGTTTEATPRPTAPPPKSTSAPRRKRGRR